jgi:drug/metabolite transporter (DMT)-like permease
MGWIGTLIAAFLVSTTWICCAILARSSDAIFLPQAIRFLSAAFVMAGLCSVAEQRPPGISVRLLHAAVTVGGLCYFVSPIFMFYGVRVLPSGLGALVYLSVPLWYLIAAYHGEDLVLADYVMTGVGLVVFCIGVIPDSYVRGAAHLPLLCLLLGMFAFMIGGWVTRRLFWAHSSLDLAFWSMLFAGITHILMGIVCGEHHELPNWDTAYWGYLLFLGFLVTGLGAFMGHVRRSLPQMIAFTAIPPILAMLWGFALWRETPLNPFTVLGFGLVLYPVLRVLRLVPLSRWMVLTLYNDKRQGERLVCQLDAEINSQPARIIDIGLDGVGFRGSHPFKADEKVVLTFPIGRDGNSVLVHCRVAHATEVAGNKGFPCAGGLEFQKISTEHKQSLVEFLARLARAEEG